LVFKFNKDNVEQSIEQDVEQNIEQDVENDIEKVSKLRDHLRRCFVLAFETLKASFAD
jgi:hypothetical protein